MRSWTSPGDHSEKLSWEQNWVRIFSKRFSFFFFFWVLQLFIFKLQDKKVFLRTTLLGANSPVAVNCGRGGTGWVCDGAFLSPACAVCCCRLAPPGAGRWTCTRATRPGTFCACRSSAGAASSAWCRWSTSSAAAPSPRRTRTTSRCLLSSVL